MIEHRVECSICMKDFRAIESQIRLICNKCYEERPPDAMGKEIIKKIFNDMIFNGECYKISIKNHEKWEEMLKK